MARGKKLSKKLRDALASRRKLSREFQRARPGSVKRHRAMEKIKKLDAYIGPQRRRIADEERDLLTARDRVKELRRYVEGYDAESGYDLRRPHELSRKQLKRIEDDWQKLVPVLARPHTTARPRRTHERDDIKALAEFAGLKRLPKRIKAVPVVAMAKEPGKVRVRVDASGEVQKTRGAVTERYYLFTAAEKRAMKRTGLVEPSLRDLLARMPAGRYFAVTGEGEAFNRDIEHDGPDSADDPENLIFEQVQRWIDDYGTRPGHEVEIWLRGFRKIGTVEDDRAGARERRRILKARAARDKERRAQRDENVKRARRRALGIMDE